MNFDYTLYLVTDRQLMSCDSLTEAVEQAILGGCTMIQLREKELSSLEFYNQAVAVKQVTDKYHIPLIINDRIDIAMAVQAKTCEKSHVARIFTRFGSFRGKQKAPERSPRCPHLHLVHFAPLIPGPPAYEFCVFPHERGHRSSVDFTTEK